MSNGTNDGKVDSEPPLRQHHEIHQLQIVQLSDIHFGSSHSFNPDLGPDGKPLSQVGVPSFAEILLKDLEEGDPECPTLLAITGDLTTKHEEDGFREAQEFIQKLSAAIVMGRVRGQQSIALIPGNHDIDFLSEHVGTRWYRFIEFYNQLFEADHKPHDPWSLVELIDRSHEGLMVLKLNSEIHVRKGSSDEYRGQLDEQQLERVSKLLEDAKTKLAGCIRVALIHHHPVLIPALVEANRGYDAIVRSGQLLNLLNEHGFHLVLHGHKHWPCTFTVDLENGYDESYVRPMLIVAGGSVGSSELPRGEDRNCYNRIKLKWNSDTDEVRVLLETRGLMRKDEKGKALPTRSKWHWKTVRTDDRTFYRHGRVPRIGPAIEGKAPSKHAAEENARGREYQRLRLNLPAVEVRPAVMPYQKYEAVFWIVGHSSPTGEDYRNPEQVPVEVTWSAGPMFPTLTIRREDDPRFCGVFAYYGPVLIQAAIKWADGAVEYAHIYARIPSGAEFVHPD